MLNINEYVVRWASSATMLVRTLAAFSMQYATLFIVTCSNSSMLFFHSIKIWFWKFWGNNNWIKVHAQTCNNKVGKLENKQNLQIQISKLVPFHGVCSEDFSFLLRDPEVQFLLPFSHHLTLWAHIWTRVLPALLYWKQLNILIYIFTNYQIKGLLPISDIVNLFSNTAHLFWVGFLVSCNVLILR